MRQFIIVSHLGERMKAQGVRPATMARAIGSCPSRVANWAKTGALPPLEKALLIADALLVNNLRELWTTIYHDVED